jgi:hypothetical protein
MTTLFYQHLSGENDVIHTLISLFREKDDEIMNFQKHLSFQHQEAYFYKLTQEE